MATVNKDAKRLSSKLLSKKRGRSRIDAAAKSIERGNRGTIGSELDGVPNPDSQSHLPRMTNANHDELRRRLLTRLANANVSRQDRNTRFNQILLELAVQQVVSADDLVKYRKREKSALRNIRYPKTLGHLRDLTTNVATTLFPLRQIYGSLSVNPSTQQDITALIQVMNHDARRFNHFSTLMRVIFDGYAFNVGIARASWKELSGTFVDLTAQPNSAAAAFTDANAAYQTIAKGNDLTYLDPYNCFWDDSIEPSRFGHDANFFAYVERVSDEDVIRRARRGEFILPAALRENLRTLDPATQKFTPLSTAQTPYYRTLGNLLPPSSSLRTSLGTGGLFEDRPQALTNPMMADDIIQRYTNDDGVFDIDRYAGSADYNPPNPRQGDNELLTILYRVIPKELGLGDSELETIMEFKLLNGEHIIAFGPAALAHGLMPVALTTPSSELGQGSTPSVASILSPYQMISNSLLSIFVNQALDDANNGILAYDEDKVNMSTAVEDRSGRLAVKRNNPDNDNIPLGNYFAQLQGTQANGALLNAEAVLRERANDFAPTASANQLANMNRPVNHQSRHLAQVMSMHTQTNARVIAEQLMQPLIYVQSRNIMAYGDPIETIGEDGRPKRVAPAALRGADLSFAASDGIRGVDIISLTERLDKLVNSIYQSPELRQEFDVTAITSYLLQLEGANIDVDAFKHPDPFSALPPEQKQLAVQLLQQAAQQQTDDRQGELPLR